MQIPKTNIKTTVNILHSWIDANNPEPLLLWGAPGIGKSAIVKQLAEKLECPLIDERLVTRESVDLRGVPVPEERYTTWKEVDWLPHVELHGEKGILFFDELFLASPSVQAAAYSLLHDRELGKYKLPPGWRILAASNRPEDKAGITHHNNIAALANRFACHLDVVPDVDSWAPWALNNGIAPELIAFIRFRPELLHEFADGGIPKGTVAYSTPRSLGYASKWLERSLSPSDEQKVLEGSIGKAVATELTGFLRIVRTLPDVNGILNDPNGADIPNETSTLYALASLLGKRADEDTFPAVVRYLSRTSEEFAILAVSIATARDPDLKETKTYIDFKIANKDINI